MFFQWKSTDWANQEVYRTPERNIGRLPRCVGDPDCLTLGYSIIGQPGEDYEWVNDVMRYLANDNQLLYGKDVKLLHVGPGVDEFYSYLNNNPNMTWFGLVWCTTEWPVTDDVALPCRYAHEKGTSLEVKKGE